MLKVVPNILGFFLSGGTLALPGAGLDLLLFSFHWTHADFGTALMLQGLAAFAGTRFASRRLRAHGTAAVLNALTRRGLYVLALGIALTYFSEWTLEPVYRLFTVSPAPHFLRGAGLALLGFGVGSTAVCHNTAALHHATPEKVLNAVHMGFPLGAAAFPLGASLFYQAIDGHPEAALLWRLPAALCGALCGVLAWTGFARRKDSDRLPLAARPDPETTPLKTTSSQPPDSPKAHPSSPPLGRLPAAAACATLFCYVGIEVNLSNGLVLLHGDGLGLPMAEARLASPVYWAGLCAVRLALAVTRPPLRRYATLLFGSAGACLLTFLVLLSGAWTGRAAPLTLALAIVFATGAFLGGIYSLGIGVLMRFYPPGVATDAANRATLAGVGGAVALPFLYGRIVHAEGIAAGMNFVLLLLFGLFFFTLLIWRQESRIPKHSL